MKRIQRQRTKGWRMPPNTVYVGRPSRWGNPFERADYGLDRSLALYRETLYGGWSPRLVEGMPDWIADRAYRTRTGWIAKIGAHPAEVARSELRGKDLACWCPLDQPCHADVLLELMATR